MTEILRARLERSHTKVESGCWEWKLSKFHGGYGQMKVQGENLMAHRISYMAFIGEIPDGEKVLHTCDNPCCINPEHLFLGTQIDNMKDKVSKGRQFRPKGNKNGAVTKPQSWGNLTEERVKSLRQEYELKKNEIKYVTSFLSKKYKISTNHVRLILNRKAWANI